MKSPLIYRSQTQFELLHVDERDFFGQIKTWKNLDSLAANFRLNSVYRSKADIAAESPVAKYVPIYYKLSKPHMKLYNRLMEEQLLELGDGSKIDATTANALYHAAQQIIVNFGYFAGDERLQSTTLDLIDEVCSEIDVGNPASSKLIVWAIYKRTNALLVDHLAPYNAVAAYSGSDSKASVAKFLNDPLTRILNANPGSAGAGLNPQGVCNHALFVETPTRTIQFQQCSGRIDRLGQRFTPIIRIGVALGTIQETLYKNLLKNDDLVNKVSNSKVGIRQAIYGDSQ